MLAGQSIDKLSEIIDDNQNNLNICDEKGDGEKQSGKTADDNSEMIVEKLSQQEISEYDVYFLFIILICIFKFIFNGK